MEHMQYGKKCRLLSRCVKSITNGCSFRAILQAANRFDGGLLSVSRSKEMCLSGSAVRSREVVDSITRAARDRESFRENGVVSGDASTRQFRPGEADSKRRSDS
jgi:hypothetical protein